MHMCMHMHICVCMHMHRGSRVAQVQVWVWLQEHMQVQVCMPIQKQGLVCKWVQVQEWCGCRYQNGYWHSFGCGCSSGCRFRNWMQLQEHMQVQVQLCMLNQKLVLVCQCVHVQERCRPSYGYLHNIWWACSSRCRFQFVSRCPVWF